MLSKEHIIPAGLGGLTNNHGHMAIIYEASCQPCAEITRNFERSVIENVFGIARAKAGVKQTHGGQHKKYHWMKTKKYGVALPTMFTIQEFPIHATVPVFEDPPTPLTQAGKRSKITYMFLMISQPQMKRLGSVSWTFNGDGQHDLLRLFYKIAHCYSYYLDWPGLTFVPYLSPFILNTRLPDDDPLWLLIGNPEKKLRHNPPMLHGVDHSVDEVDGRRIVRVQMRLFSNHNGSHTVEVISGHLEPKSA